MPSNKILKMCIALFMGIQLSGLFEKKGHEAHAQPISILKVNPSSSQLATSIKTRSKLFSRTRMFLRIDQNGTVGGTKNCNDQYIQLEISSVGTGLLRIKGVQSGRYLAMNSKGYLYSLTTPNDEAVFKNELQSSGYHTFASIKYYQTILYDTFVSIRKNGATKNGTRTNKYQKSVQYLMITNTTC